MSDPEPTNVVRQREWTEEELLASGFRYYPRKKQCVLVRELPEEESPKTIETSWASLVAHAGDMIVYNPTFIIQKNLEDYEHWPVRKDIFEQTYAPWDEIYRTSIPGEIDLLRRGCKAYFKKVGAWARVLTEPTYVQSLESPEPVLYPPGAWLCIGSKGEPWVQADDTFRSRYDTSEAAE
jgi:hypothetical protein